MNATSIEWVKNPDGSQGYTHNSMSGCENHTPEGLCLGGLFPCYAYKLAHTRLKSRYLANDNIAEPDPQLDFPMGKDGMFTNPFYPRFWGERLYHPWGGKPKGIFVCDMGDLFGQGIPEEWTRKVIDLARLHTENRYYLLTKQPQNLIKWSFPENCYVGVTACNWKMVFDAFWELQDVKASVKYISFEPLLDSVGHRELEGWLSRASISWLIVGACTGSWYEMYKLHERYPELELMPWGKKYTLQPRIEWVREIVEAADKAGIPVFLKENLKPLFRPGYEVRYPWAYKWGEFRQEMPKGEK